MDYDMNKSIISAAQCKPNTSGLYAMMNLTIISTVVTILHSNRGKIFLGPKQREPHSTPSVTEL